MNDAEARQVILDELAKKFDAMPKEPYTNYDRIINMSVNEMAEWLASKIQCRSCFLYSCTDDKECDEIFKQWLLAESEVKE